MDTSLLGLRVRIPPGAWMFLLCVLFSKGQKAKARTIRTDRSTAEVQRQKTRIYKRLLNIGVLSRRPGFDSKLLDV